MGARFVRVEEVVGSNPATPTGKAPGQALIEGLTRGSDTPPLGENWEMIL